MFHLVYYAKSFHFSSCLEGIPLKVFKKLGHCSWLSRMAGLWILSKVLICFRKCGSHDADAYSSIGRTKVTAL